MKIILYGKSGVGKSTQEKLVANILGIPKVVSTTTRQIRPGETDGYDYHFVTIDTFEKLLARDAFVQTSMFKGNHYGIQHSHIADTCITVMEPNGIMQMQGIYDDVVPIKLTLPENLRQERLSHRNTGQSVEDEERFDHFFADHEVTSEGEPEEIARHIVAICREYLA